MSDSWYLLFTWVDYLLFAITLLLSVIVGIYHAWRGSGSSTSEYLMGGKTMPIFPIAMSLGASTISATTLLGAPTEIYLNGSMYLWVVVSGILCIPFASYAYLTTFYKLKIVSANEYLELRFNRIIRRITSALYIIKALFYLSIVVLGPSLALAQVSGIDVIVAVSILFTVCTFYTAIGGIKAVAWTDTIQVILMYGSLLIVFSKSVYDIGGLQVIWERNFNSSRIELLNIDVDPTTTYTVWSLTIGGFFYWLSWYAVDQTSVQRFLTMPSLRNAKTAMWGNMAVVVTITLLTGSIGLIMYAKYYDCDPLTSKLVNKADQIVPFFVMGTIGEYPGLPGLFIAGIFSGALSTLSSVLNAVALVILEDFVRPFFKNLAELSATRIAKAISLVFGCLSFAMVFVVGNVRTILDATLSLDGAVGGSVLGVFTLGIFVPRSNSLGAAIGMLAAFGSMMWLGISAQIAKSHGYISNKQAKPLSTEGCSLNVTVATTETPDLETGEKMAFSLLQISYMWYAFIGMSIVLIIGTAVSLVTKAPDRETLLSSGVLSSLYTRNYAQERTGEVTKSSYQCENDDPDL